MKVNSQTIQLEHSISVYDFLIGHSYQPDRVAVEHNGDIVPKSKFQETMLSDADTLEIVTFVGGG